MGIRPSGLGLRLMSLQLQPELALAGDRWPLDIFPLPFITSGAGDISVAGCVTALAAVSPDSFRARPDVLLLDRALSMSLLALSISSSTPSSIGTWAAAFFFLTDLVVGPKYSSCDSSFTSDGVGEGEMTLGVAGIETDECGMLKGRKEGVLTTPVKMCVICEAHRSQLVEWRCLSLREARLSVSARGLEGEDVETVIGSSGTRGAG